GLGGEHEDRRELEIGERAQRLHEVDAVHARHVHVRDDEVELAALRLGERGNAVGRLGHLVPRVLQCEAHHLPHGGGIVDNQNSRHCISFQKISTASSPLRRPWTPAGPSLPGASGPPRGFSVPASTMPLPSSLTDNERVSSKIARNAVMRSESIGSFRRCNFCCVMSWNCRATMISLMSRWISLPMA